MVVILFYNLPLLTFDSVELSFPVVSKLCGVLIKDIANSCVES